jgi:EAL domain-containing protein (putative c-di-GMP-specific phosphodiesterase class I)
MVQRSLDTNGIDPARLKLELTESVVLDNVDAVVSRMQQLIALGVSFCLDDFGTGYSSLSYLKRLPLEQVKIDQSFVRDVTEDQNDAAIVRAIMAMSRSLGLQVIAEGVETQAQRDFLLRNECRAYQGFLFCGAVPIEEWERLLT